MHNAKQQQQQQQQTQQVQNAMAAPSPFVQQVYYCREYLKKAKVEMNEK